MHIDEKNIDYLGIDRVLRRGTGKILENSADVLFVYDTISKAHLLACWDIESGLKTLEKHSAPGYSALMVSNVELGRLAYERYGFLEGLECYQAAYYGEPPVPCAGISIRTADETDLPVLVENYESLAPAEMALLVEMGNIVMGYDGNRLVGFIGEHLEGSIGLLYIFPEFRRRGYAEALERHFIVRTIEKGFVPFGQVEKSNTASLELQRKLGLTRSENLIYWMWK